jgi:Rps23 Pro-64 3,4-dihydroxylase Tpa1-like proline 4-hydroxylase
MLRLGDWKMKIDTQPFWHAVIDDFLDEAAATRLADEAFPPLDDPGWIRYDNPIEIKSARTDGASEYLDLVKSPEFVEIVRRVSGMPDIFCDPTMHGAGLHCHSRGGKLDVHLDYSIHPITGKERRLNLVLYLNRDWAWNGDLEFWTDDACARRVAPLFNRAVMFETGDASWHGMPAPLTCPEGVARKSIAAYYVSEPRPGATPRPKAFFRPLPGQPVPDGLRKLYAIRGRRTISPEDIEALYPAWRTDVAHGEGYWILPLKKNKTKSIMKRSNAILIAAALLLTVTLIAAASSRTRRREPFCERKS